MKSKPMDTQARIKAREDWLEARANMRLERAKEKANHLINNSGTELVNNALVSIGNKVPVLSFITKMASNRINKSQRNREARELAHEQVNSQPYGGFSVRGGEVKRAGGLLTSILKRNVLPLLYTFGSMQLLTYSLKGAGKMLRSGVSRLLFRRKRRG